MHPGKRNSLDALCDRYGVSNAHRKLHGALLDAELLADVYLSMTRGQNSLSMDDEVETRRRGGMLEAVALAEIIVAARQRRRTGRARQPARRAGQGRSRVRASGALTPTPDRFSARIRRPDKGGATKVRIFVADAEHRRLASKRMMVRERKGCHERHRATCAAGRPHAQRHHLLHPAAASRRKQIPSVPARGWRGGQCPRRASPRRTIPVAPRLRTRSASSASSTESVRLASSADESRRASAIGSSKVKTVFAASAPARSAINNPAAPSPGIRPWGCDEVNSERLRPTCLLCPHRCWTHRQR